MSAPLDGYSDEEKAVNQRLHKQFLRETCCVELLRLLKSVHFNVMRDVVDSNTHNSRGIDYASVVELEEEVLTAIQRAEAVLKGGDSTCDSSQDRSHTEIAERWTVEDADLGTHGIRIGKDLLWGCDDYQFMCDLAYTHNAALSKLEADTKRLEAALVQIHGVIDSGQSLQWRYGQMCLIVRAALTASDPQAMSDAGEQRWTAQSIRDKVNAALSKLEAERDALTRWRETANEPPIAADAIKEDGDELVLAWTDPEGSFAQNHPYNAVDFHSVIKFPDVYPFWIPLIQKPQ